MDYSPPTSLISRPRFQRKIAFVVLIVAVALAIWRWGPSLYLRARTESWRKQCIAYTLPNVAVFEADPQGASSLLQQKGYSPVGLGIGQPPGAAVNIPACGRLLFTESSTSPQPNILLFLHRLTTRSGQSRVVAIKLDIPQFPVPDKVIQPPLAFAVYTFLPEVETLVGGPAFKRDHQQRFTAECYGFWDALNDRSLRFYAGQADQGDSSHFTIGYSAHGQPGTIDGWAEDAATGGLFDGASDTERQWHLRLLVRDGPAKGGVTIDNAGDRIIPLDQDGVDDANARYLVGGHVSGFGRIAKSRSENELVWRVQITHVYSGPKNLLGKSFGIMGNLAAYYPGDEVPPALRLRDDGIWWVSRGMRNTPDDTIWSDMQGVGRAKTDPDYAAIVEWAQAVEKVEAAPLAQREELLRQLSHHANHRIAEWAKERFRIQ